LGLVLELGPFLELGMLLNLQRGGKMTWGEQTHLEAQNLEVSDGNPLGLLTPGVSLDL
jgi:hypothetical protein